MSAERSEPIEGWLGDINYEMYFDDPGEGDALDLLVTVLDPVTRDYRQSMGIEVSRFAAVEFQQNGYSNEIEAALRLLPS